MAKLRSPNCPQMTFEEAAAKARKVYEQEHTHAADKNVIIEDMGYSGISGASLSTLGAIRQYGLLEPSGEGLRISEDAVAYFELPPEDLDRRAALVRMAFRPKLFEELRDQFGAELPSEGNLRHTLIKRGFIPKAADEVMRVYRENVALVGNNITPYNGDEEDGQPEASKPRQQTVTPDRECAAPAPASRPVPNMRAYSFALSPDAKAELQIVGEITADDLETLRDYVEITIKALTRKAKSDVATVQA